MVEIYIRKKDRTQETGNVQYIIHAAQKMMVESVNDDALDAMMEAYYRGGYTYYAGGKMRGKCRCGCSG